MIQYKAKNKYWTSAKRWYKLHRWPMTFEDLCFEDYNYILGDKIYTEANEESLQAFNRTVMWMELQA